MKQNFHTHTLLAALLPLLVCLTGCMREAIVSGPAVAGQGGDHRLQFRRLADAERGGDNGRENV